MHVGGWMVVSCMWMVLDHWVRFYKILVWADGVGVQRHERKQDPTE